MNHQRRAVFVAVALLLAVGGIARSQAPPRAGVSVAPGGRLVYTADARGDTIVDFSHAGYGGGGAAIPDVPPAIVVRPGDGDDGARVQAALEIVSARPVAADGFRGAVLLEPGRFDVAASIRISSTGVVLRGSGSGAAGTELVATGTSRRALIEIAGRGSPAEIPTSRRTIVDRYVPVGSRHVTLNDVNGFHIGDEVMVTRPSTIEWIGRLGMNAFEGWRPEDRLHWQPGSRDIV